MRHRLIRGLLLALLASILAIAPVQQERAVAAETVKLGIGDWPPYFAQNLKHGGSFAYIVTQAFGAAGYGVSDTFLPWKRALAMAQSGELDGSPGWKVTDERRKSFLFSDPVIVSTSVFFHLKSAAISWHSLDDLKGKRIGVTAGYSYGPAFDAAVQDKRLVTDAAEDDLTAFKMLLGGRTDLLVMNRDVGLDIMHRALTSSQAGTLTYEPQPIDEQPSYLMIAKSCPRAAQLIADFNRGLANIKAAGVIDQVKRDIENGVFF